MDISIKGNIEHRVIEKKRRERMNKQLEKLKNLLPFDILKKVILLVSFCSMHNSRSWSLNSLFEI
jgi:hypothetical protein